MPHLHLLAAPASRLSRAAVALGAGLLLAQAAQAVALTEPTGIQNFADTALGGTTSAARPELAGTVLADVLTPFSFSGVSGTVQSRVVREDGSGTLDFYWKINVDPSTTNGLGVSALRIDHFGYSHITDADWRIDGLGTVGPDTARLFNEANIPSGAINFLFGNGVNPGASSRFFFLHTDATAFAQTANFDLLTTGPQNLSGIFTTFAPVPEPTTVGLLLAGLTVLGAAARRRRQA